MLQPILTNLFSSNQHQLFNRTRWRLAIWYAGMMGIVLVVSGLGTYHALVHAYRLTISQELDLIANELHEILEPILKEPGKIDSEAIKVLPDLCLVNTKCWEVDKNRAEDSLQSHKYDIRLFDLSGNLIAVMGKPTQNLSNANMETYGGQVAVDLHTQDFQVWGLLKIRRLSSEYEAYMTHLHWVFIFGIPLLIVTLILISWWLAGLAIQPVRQSYQLLQQFTADAAHELRTPLAAIGATVESTLMVPTITEIETKETLQTIGRQNARLSNLVADLLMLCRMDRQLSVGNSSNLPTTTVEQVSLNNLIEDIVEDFSSLAINSKIQLDVRSATSELLTIEGNYEQLYRMVSNLVANALQYTLPGGEIKLVLNHNGQYSEISVEDTGIGISEWELNKIFTRFYRINSDRSRDTGGSGLGLSIAMAIAKTYQGNIKVESKLGKGSKFTIFLPI